MFLAYEPVRFLVKLCNWCLRGIIQTELEVAGISNRKNVALDYNSRLM